MKRRKYIIGSLCLSSAAGFAFAPFTSRIVVDEVIVEIRNGSTVQFSKTLTPGEDWTYTIFNNTNRINIRPSNNTVDIGRLTFWGGNGQNVDIILGTGTGLGNGIGALTVGNDWEGVDSSAGSANFRFYGGITGDLTGSILVDEMDRFDADGQIQALVQADDPYSIYFRVHADSVSSTGSINCVNGSIERVVITNDCNGSITADGSAGRLRVLDINGGLFGNVSTSGALENLDVANDIGTTTAHVTIDALKINNIIADNIYADIVGDSALPNNGRVRRIETRAGGDFDGSLTLREFHEIGGTGNIGLYVLGDLNADITFTKQLNLLGRIDITGDLAASSTINIFRHLTGPIIIGNAGGLKGQIIVNSGDLSPAGDWTGNVSVGPTILSPEPLYTQTGLGGGAVGEVAFDCHLQDSVPGYTNSTRPTLGDGNNNTPFKVTLRHYGPVIWLIDDAPIKVMFCNGGTCDSDTDVSNDFEVTNTAGTRDVVVEPKSGTSPGLGEYHISPTTDLDCDDTTAVRPDVASYTYDVKYEG